MFRITHTDDRTAVYAVVNNDYEDTTRGTIVDNKDGTFTSRHVCGDVTNHSSYALAVWHLNDVEMLASV